MSLTLFATEHDPYQFPLLSYIGNIETYLSDTKDPFVTSGGVGRTRTWQMLIGHGWRPIMMREIQYLRCNRHNLFKHVLDFMGQNYEEGTILLSANDQVIYPSILETGAIHGDAYLQLRYTPGSLRWDGLDFKCTSVGYSAYGSTNNVGTNVGTPSRSRSPDRVLPSTAL